MIKQTLIVIVLSVFVSSTILLALIIAQMTQPIGIMDKQDIPARADADNLQQYVTDLAEILPPRFSKDNLLASAEYIYSIFDEYGDAKLDPFEIPSTEEYEGGTFHNVSVEFGPNEGKRIVVGAHYDAAAGLPGADDNASGIAGLLELARMFADAELNTTVELVAYALEELPHFGTDNMGSAVHAQRLTDNQIQVEFMLSLEMIGYFDATPGVQNYPLPFLDLIYPNHGDYIALVSNLKNISLMRRFKKAMILYAELDVYSINAPASIPGIDRSDHLNYWKKGIPALMVTDTAYNRNHAYHTQYDTPELLNYDRMAQVVEAVYAAVIRIANENRISF